MKINDLLEKLSNFAPLSLAYEWDNCGLLCGRRDSDITGICVCLDVSDEVIKKAIENDCNTILSHHPFIFEKIKNIDTSSYFGKMLCEIIKNDINVISMHTNIDKAQNGINQRLAELLNLDNIQVLEKDNNFLNVGMGRMGYLKENMSLKSFSEFVSDKLNTNVRVIGDENTIISKVAVGGGSCIELSSLAIENCCDVFVTGDVKYHSGMDADRAGLCVIDAGHYGTEICVVDIFTSILKDCNVKVIKVLNCDIWG